MREEKRKKVNVKLNYIICSLYTLLPENKIFKTLNLNCDFYQGINSNEYYCIKLKFFLELPSLKNNPSIRKLAYYLLIPILTEGSYISRVDKELLTHTVLLKKYLKKFRYNYTRHFCQNHGSIVTFPSEKEINSSAIESLFLLTGI